MRRSACGAVAGAIAALAISLSSSGVRANPREDWAKCLSFTKIPSAERISSCTAALASGTDEWASSRAYFLRGQAYFDEKNFDAAVADFSQFIQAYPAKAQGYQARAAAYFWQRNFDPAIADYTRAIELGPDTLFVHVYRAQAYQAKGDTDHAIADFSKAIEFDPKDVRAYCAVAHAYVVKGDFDRAFTNFDQSIQIDPAFRDGYLGRGTIHRLRGEFDLAIADYDQAIRIDPQSAIAYFDRALIHWKRGSLSQSLADFDEAGRLNPKRAYAALWRDIVAKRDNQPSQLAEAATKLDMTKWPAPIVNLFLGTLTSEQVLSAADDSDSARKKGKLCEANFYAAELALQRGAKDDARRSLELAAADCPNGFVESWAATVELKTLSANP